MILLDSFDFVFDGGGVARGHDKYLSDTIQCQKFNLEEQQRHIGDRQQALGLRVTERLEVSRK